MISGFDTIVIITDKLNSLLNAAILIDFEFDVVRCRLYRDPDRDALSFTQLYFLPGLKSLLCMCVVAVTV